MNQNLLIVGAGIYGVVAKEIAENMNCFDKIDFVDDEKQFTPMGVPVVGKTKDLTELNSDYSNIIVAIGCSEVRRAMLKKLQEEANFKIVTLVSPDAYIAPSALIMPGCIIEPMAVVQSMSVIAAGCILSAGAVVNHASMCCDGVHVDCNGTVAGNTLVPSGMKIKAGEMYDGERIDVNNLFSILKCRERA